MNTRYLADLVVVAWTAWLDNQVCVLGASGASRQLKPIDPLGQTWTTEPVCLGFPMPVLIRRWEQSVDLHDTSSAAGTREIVAWGCGESTFSVWAP